MPQTTKLLLHTVDDLNFLTFSIEFDIDMLEHDGEGHSTKADDCRDILDMLGAAAKRGRLPVPARHRLFGGWTVHQRRNPARRNGRSPYALRRLHRTLAENRRMARGGPLQLHLGCLAWIMSARLRRLVHRIAEIGASHCPALMTLAIQRTRSPDGAGHAHPHHPVLPRHSNHRLCNGLEHPTGFARKCPAQKLRRLVGCRIYDCAAKAFQKADAELNAVWKKALATIGQGDSADGTLTAAQAEEWKNDLVAAQKAWNTFKDMDCNEARSFEYWSGSARSLAVLSCQYEYTIARTEDLRARYLQL